MSRDAQDYTEMTNEFGAPAVFALCKGLRMVAAKDQEITQESLAQKAC